MIKIVEGNDIHLHVPLVEIDAEGHKTAIDATQLSELLVTLTKGGAEYTDYTLYTVNNSVVICLNETTPRGLYAIKITAKNNGVDIAYNEKEAFEIVRYNRDATYLDHIADEDVTLDTAIFCAAIVNDAQIEELREELREAKAQQDEINAALEEEKENLIEAAETLGELDGVAQQGDNPNATNTAILEVLANLDISNVAKEANATANKNAILNDIAAKASAILGTDATATLTALKTAIAGLSIPTVQQIQSGLAKTSELPTDYAKQGANTSATLSDTQGAVKNSTTTALAELLNNTYGLAALQTLIGAITGYALQGTDPTATNTAIKNAIANIDLSTVAKQGSDATATLTAVASAIATLATAVAAIPTTTPATPTDVSNAQTAIIGAMPSVSGLASETSVKDGNDTAISLLKDGTFGLSAIKTIVQAISGYALQGSDPTATNTAILSAILSNAGTPQLTIPNTTASQELASNTVYLFESRTNNLTLTLGTPIAGQNNEYHFFVMVGATAPSITYPSGISWNGGSAPTIATNKNYEISINNNIAAYFEI